MIKRRSLIVGLLIGVLVSIFQAATSIQEMTLTFIPKLIAVLGAGLLIFLVVLGFIVKLFIKYFGQIQSDLFKIIDFLS